METTVTKNTKALSNNVVTLSGEITSEANFSHEIFGEKFYNYTLTIARLSEETDNIQLAISERLIMPDALPVGSKVTINGQFRSFNKHEGPNNRLILYVFVREIELIDEITNANNIALNGFICKKPIYRVTPMGREICDLLVAVNRPYGKSDYIPCICWGRNAKYAASLEVSQEIIVHGRIQSREYEKKLSEEQVETRTAYEVSISKIEEVNK